MPDEENVMPDEGTRAICVLVLSILSAVIGAAAIGSVWIVL